MLPMSEEQIERHVERMVDRLDRAFLAGEFGQIEYNKQMHEINRWADVEYRFRQTAG
jgi:hypothetical protein